MKLSCPCKPQPYSGRASGTDTVKEKATQKAIHKAVQAFIDAIDDHQCDGNCYPVFTNLSIKDTDTGYTDASTHEVTMIWEWRLTIECKKPLQKKTKS